MVSQFFRMEDRPPESHRWRIPVRLVPAAVQAEGGMPAVRKAGCSALLHAAAGRILPGPEHRILPVRQDCQLSFRAAAGCLPGFRSCISCSRSGHPMTLSGCGLLCTAACLSSRSALRYRLNFSRLQCCAILCFPLFPFNI